jgi:hypothetical protein
MYEPGRQAAADEYDLVRPYLLGGDGPWLPPRGAQLGDPFALRLLGDTSEPGWPKDGARPGPAPLEPDWPPPGPRHRAPAGWSLAGWSRELRGRPRPAVISTVAVVIVIASALIALLAASRNGPCAGGRPCHSAAAGVASLRPGQRPTAPAHAPAAPVRASARPSLPSAAASTPASAPPEPTPTQPATAEPTPATFAPVTTPPLPGVTVSYRTVRFWASGFEGEFTIVNGGSVPVRDWQLAVVLPGDRVLVTWNARLRATGASAVLTPRSHQAVIEPGASVSEHFIASGTEINPQSCTLNGVPCS